MLKSSRSFNRNLSSLVEEVVVDDDDDLTNQDSGNIKLTSAVAFFRTDDCNLNLYTMHIRTNDMKKRKRDSMQEVGMKTDINDFVRGDSLQSHNWHKESSSMTEETRRFLLSPSDRGPKITLPEILQEISSTTSGTTSGTTSEAEDNYLNYLFFDEEEEDE